MLNAEYSYLATPREFADSNAKTSYPPNFILLKPNELHIIRKFETATGHCVGDHRRLASALRMPQHAELVA